MKRTHKPVNQAFCGAHHAELQERVLAVASATMLSVPDLIRIGIGRVVEEFERSGQVIVKTQELRMEDEFPRRRPHPLFG